MPPGSTTASPTTSPTTSATQGSVSEGVGSGPDTTSIGDDADDEGCGFICHTDVSIGIECDVWTQDCPPGYKCNPWANTGSAYNDTRCSPIVDQPAHAGEPCETVDSPASGIDDCDATSFCLALGGTNEGTCVAYCIGSLAMPHCANPAEACTITNDGVLIPCLPRCHPLDPSSCAEGFGCVDGFGTFVCLQSYDDGLGYAEACETLHACGTGLFCAEAQHVPECTDAYCCTAFCDLAAELPDAACPGQAQVCAPWYSDGFAPPGLENVGYCTVG